VLSRPLGGSTAASPVAATSATSAAPALAGGGSSAGLRLRSIGRMCLRAWLWPFRFGGRFGGRIGIRTFAGVRGPFRVVEEAVRQTCPTVWSRHGRRFRRGRLLVCGGLQRKFCGGGRSTAEALDGLCGLDAPLVAAEALVGLAVPIESFALALSLLVNLGQLEGHHAVVRLQEELFELCGGVCARARLADARLYLLPVSHGWAF
jgi:hypothetical protein